MGSVREKWGKLFLDFRHGKKRLREMTGLDDTPKNRVACEAKLKIIEGEMVLGTFRYAEHFPDGTQRQEADRTRITITSRSTVAAWLTRWHERRSPFRRDGSLMDEADLHPTTWLHDQGTIKNRITTEIGDIAIERLRLSECLEFRRTLLDELSAKTVTNIMGLLHKAMADAVEEGLIPTNPVPRLKSRARRDANLKKNSKPLTIDQIESFLDALPNGVRLRDAAMVSGDTLHDLYSVWFSTGWRSNEIVALRFDWLDVPREVVELRGGRSPRRGGLEATPKTGQREVNCGYAPEIFEAFERRKRGSLETGHRDYVFTDSRGRPLSQEWLAKRVWGPTLRVIGIPHRGQYNIRDTFITNSLSEGEDPGWVAEVCGTSEEMLFRHYRKWMPSQRRTDGGRIAARLRAKGQRSEARKPRSVGTKMGTKGTR